MVRREGIGGFLDRNLWAILAASFALYGGYATGQATTVAKIESLARDNARLERRVAGRTELMHCMVRNIDRLYVHSGQATSPACEMRIPE
jgi:hypothetical protein